MAILSKNNTMSANEGDQRVPRTEAQGVKGVLAPSESPTSPSSFRILSAYAGVALERKCQLSANPVNCAIARAVDVARTDPRCANMPPIVYEAQPVRSVDLEKRLHRVRPSVLILQLPYERRRDSHKDEERCLHFDGEDGFDEVPVRWLARALAEHNERAPRTERLKRVVILTRADPKFGSEVSRFLDHDVRVIISTRNVYVPQAQAWASAFVQSVCVGESTMEAIARGHKNINGKCPEAIPSRWGMSVQLHVTEEDPLFQCYCGGQLVQSDESVLRVLGLEDGQRGLASSKANVDLEIEDEVSFQHLPPIPVPCFRILFAFSTWGRNASFAGFTYSVDDAVSNAAFNLRCASMAPIVYESYSVRKLDLPMRLQRVRPTVLVLAMPYHHARGSPPDSPPVFHLDDADESGTCSVSWLVGVLREHNSSVVHSEQVKCVVVLMPVEEIGCRLSCALPGVSVIAPTRNVKYPQAAAWAYAFFHSICVGDSVAEAIASGHKRISNVCPETRRNCGLVRVQHRPLFVCYGDGQIVQSDTVYCAPHEGLYEPTWSHVCSVLRTPVAENRGEVSDEHARKPSIPNPRLTISGVGCQVAFGDLWRVGDDCGKAHKRVVISGVAGMGKSIIARVLAELQTYPGWPEHIRAVVLIDLVHVTKRWMAKYGACDPWDRRVPTVEQVLAWAFDVELAHAAEIAKWLSAHRGEVVWVFDGYYLTGYGRVTGFSQWFPEIIAGKDIAWNNTLEYILVMTRLQRAEKLPQSDLHLSLQPWRESRIREYVSKYFARIPGGADTKHPQLALDVLLGSSVTFTGIPIVCEIVCDLIASEQYKPPWDLHSLYGHLVDRMWRHETRTGRPATAQTKYALQSIALYALRNDGNLPNRGASLVVDPALEAAAEEEARRATERGVNLSKGTVLARNFDGASQCWAIGDDAFVHRSILEYLAAQCLAAHSEEVFSVAVSAVNLNAENRAFTVFLSGSLQNSLSDGSGAHNRQLALTNHIMDELVQRFLNVRSDYSAAALDASYERREALRLACGASIVMEAVTSLASPQSTALVRSMALRSKYALLRRVLLEPAARYGNVELVQALVTRGNAVEALRSAAVASQDAVMKWCEDPNGGGVDVVEALKIRAVAEAGHYLLLSRLIAGRVPGSDAVVVTDSHLLRQCAQIAASHKHMECLRVLIRAHPGLSQPVYHFAMEQKLFSCCALCVAEFGARPSHVAASLESAVRLQEWNFVASLIPILTDTSLDLSACGMNINSVEALKPALQELPRALHSIDASDNHMGTEAARLILNALATNTSLTDLNLNGNDVDTSMISVQVLTFGNAMMTRCLLEGRLYREGWVEASQVNSAISYACSTRKRERLRVLVEVGGADPFAVFMQGLRECWWDLCDECTRVHGVPQDMLDQWRRAASGDVETLLSRARKEGWMAFACAVALNTELRVLDLRDLSLDLPSLEVLGHCVRLNTDLHTLRLDTSALSASECMDVAAGLRRNSSLVCLELKGCDPVFGEEGLQEFVAHQGDDFNRLEDEFARDNPEMAAHPVIDGCNVPDVIHRDGCIRFSFVGAAPKGMRNVIPELVRNHFTQAVERAREETVRLHMLPVRVMPSEIGITVRNFPTYVGSHDPHVLFVCMHYERSKVPRTIVPAPTVSDAPTPVETVPGRTRARSHATIGRKATRATLSGRSRTIVPAPTVSDAPTPVEAVPGHTRTRSRLTIGRKATGATLSGRSVTRTRSRLTIGRKETGAANVGGAVLHFGDVANVGETERYKSREMSPTAFAKILKANTPQLVCLVMLACACEGGLGSLVSEELPNTYVCVTTRKLYQTEAEKWAYGFSYALGQGRGIAEAMLAGREHVNTATSWNIADNEPLFVCYRNGVRLYVARRDDQGDFRYVCDTTAVASKEGHEQASHVFVSTRGEVLDDVVLRLAGAAGSHAALPRMLDILRKPYPLSKPVTLIGGVSQHALDLVFVPMTVRAVDPQEVPRTDQEEDAPREFQTKVDEVIDRCSLGNLWAMAERHGHPKRVVIEGVAGMGKSTIAHMFGARQGVSGWPESIVVVVVINLAVINKWWLLKLANAKAKSELREQAGLARGRKRGDAEGPTPFQVLRWQFGLSKRESQHLDWLKMHRRQVVWVFDSYDEVEYRRDSASNHTGFDDWLESIVKDRLDERVAWEGMVERMIVMSRPGRVAATFANALHVRLDPWGEAAIRRYIDRYVRARIGGADDGSSTSIDANTGEAEASDGDDRELNQAELVGRMEHVLLHNPSLSADFTGIPFICEIACHVASTSDVSVEGADLCTLYAKMVECMWGHETTQTPLLRAVLGETACYAYTHRVLPDNEQALFQNGGSQGGPGLLSGAIGNSLKEHVTGDRKALKAAFDAMHKCWAIRSNGFAHKTIMEYLVADTIVAHSVDDFKGGILSLMQLDPARERMLLLFVAGRLRKLGESKDDRQQARNKMKAFALMLARRVVKSYRKVNVPSMDQLNASFDAREGLRRMCGVSLAVEILTMLRSDKCSMSFFKQLPGPRNGALRPITRSLLEPAAQYGNLFLVRRVVKHCGAKSDGPLCATEALRAASVSGQDAVITWCQDEAKADPCALNLVVVAAAGHHVLLEKLWADPNTIHSPDVVREAVRAAAERGQLEAVRVLVREAGARPADALDAATADQVRQQEVVSLCLNELGVTRDAGAVAALACRRKVWELLHSVLRLNSMLTTLDLSNMDIPTEGVTAVASGLRRNSTLKRLNLRGNHMSSKGALILARSLGPPLCWISVKGNAIGDEGCVALVAQALSTCTTLTHLDVSGNGIGTVGAIALTQGLRDHPSLCVLDVSWNRLGSEACDALLSAGEHSTSLRRLEARRCGKGNDVYSMRLLVSECAVRHEQACDWTPSAPVEASSK